ncbi:DUF4214 domain-containing protein [Roseiterribacter gracilis]|uniref:DUF4214 domain-containing protein n=1 Tax=Roseiterribacter gracilis TaxID=2812848 RepID=A0A8S8XIE8_9PROT|nr:hypothetical protein TMPK1_36440 [Rhodospirillales bacterium TMPK1]
MATIDFVNQLYANIFGRTPSSAEANFWVGRIDLGVETSSQVALDFITSAEGVRAQQVERMYQATFGRTPDLAGFKVQIGALSSGAITLNQLAINFANSAEFQAVFVGTGTFNVTTFATAMYTNILGRAPDAAGLAVQVNFYNSLIAAGQSPAQAQATLLTNFANSAEFVNNPSINFDKVVLAYAGVDNQIPVSTTAAPNASLQQLAGVPLSTLVGALNDGTNGNGVPTTGIVNGVTLSLPATAGAISPTSASATTKTTALNDLIIGDDTTAVKSTSIDGGDGSDTLRLAMGATAAVLVTTTNVENVDVTTANGATTTFTGATTIGGQFVGISSLALRGAGTNTVAGLNATTTVTIAGSGTTGVENLAYGATVTAPKINTSGTFATTKINAAGATSLTVNATGATTFTSLDLDTAATSKALNKLTITGTAGVTVTAVTNGLAAGFTVDASAAGGAVSFADYGTDLTFTGGASADTVLMGANLTAKDVLNGGAGVNVLGVTSSASIVGVTGLQITNFQTLDISGTGTASNYDLTKLPTGIVNVQSSTGVTAATTISNVAATGTSLSFIGTDASTADLTISGATGNTALTLNIVGQSATTGSSVEATGKNLVLTGFKTLTVNSSGTTSGTNSIAGTIVDANLQTVTITGSSQTSITKFDATDTALSLVDGSKATGALTLDVSGITTPLQGITISGGSAADTITGQSKTTGALGSTINAGGGADTITISNNTNVFGNTLFYGAATDSQLGTATKAGFDSVTGFVSVGSKATHDFIDLTTFGFTGSARGGIISQTITAADPGATASTNFFVTGGIQRGVAFGTFGGDTYVYVDANKSGSFEAASDMVIKLVGITSVSLADFNF